MFTYEGEFRKTNIDCNFETKSKSDNKKIQIDRPSGTN